jgi:HEXXH motif-containing protein
MVGRELLDLVGEELPSGQARLAGSMKLLASHQETPIGELLNFSDDRPFLEPLLFTYFSRSDSPIPLEQILYASVPAGRRPVSIRAFADGDGVISLPGIGSVLTEVRGREVTLVPADAPTAFAIEHGGRTTPCAFEPAAFAGDTGIELSARIDPLTAAFFRRSAGRPPEPAGALLGRCAGPLRSGLGALERAMPACYECIKDVTRRITIFHDEALNSFASLSAHGCSFLNVVRDENDTFFVEDLVHQSGHVIFSAMTLEPGDHFVVDPDTELRTFSGEAADGRSVYVAYHGVFTECLMCVSLFQCHAHRLFAGRRAHELLGRLAFILRRLYLDLRNLRREDLFSPKGVSYFRIFERVFDDIYGRVKHLVLPLDLGNQPYTFDYGLFAERNPVEECTLSHV